MKTIIKAKAGDTRTTTEFLDTVRRVSDEEADKLIKNHDYIYVPKSFWKKYVRDAKKTVDKQQDT